MFSVTSEMKNRRDLYVKQCLVDISWKMVVIHFSYISVNDWATSCVALKEMTINYA